MQSQDAEEPMDVWHVAEKARLKTIKAP